MNNLVDFGWSKAKQQEWDDTNVTSNRPARVIADFGTSLKIATPDIITAELSGKLAHYTQRDAAPKVGDWVSVAISDNNNATIESVIFRSNEIARKVTGKRTVKQIIAANVDIAFVLLALDNDFSVERLKRFLYQLSVSSIEAIIVLNKADKTDDVQSYIEQIKSLDIPIITTIATEGIGVDAIAAHITPGKTAILLGSSGVGKSTLTNKLLGRDVQTTDSVRKSDSSGKHTTVHRELFILPNGGILIDTPGIRELQLWGTEEELDTNYDDITQIASHCKYANCQHTSEQGCAINIALADGTLEAKHYENYVKMKSELADLATKKVEMIRQSKRRDTRKSRTALDNTYSLDEDN
ncbi:MAG: ribosome small subunit-dependent GTPase A [Candidatus Saccharimonadales bacterium]